VEGQPYGNGDTAQLICELGVQREMTISGQHT